MLKAQRFTFQLSTLSFELYALCAKPPLDMARQTIVGHLFLGMTVHAPVHRHPGERFCWRLFTLADISMAALTFNLSQDDMAPMREEYMIRLFVKPLPKDFLALFMKLSYLFLFRTLCYGLIVASQTSIYVRHSGKCLFIKKGMASDAFHSLLLVFLVIKRDGLFSSRTYNRTDGEKDQKEPTCQSKEEEFHTVNHLIKIGLYGRHFQKMLCIILGKT
jgi:hypothetical protein